MDLVRGIRKSKPCCADTTCILKIRRSFDELHNFPDVVKSQNSMISTLEKGRMGVTDKGGSESTIAEMIVSICRMIGLRL